MPPRGLHVKAELLAAVRSTVLEGMREHEWTRSPGCVHQFMPPHALDSEEPIISALLCGHTALADVRPLRAASFFGPLHRAIVQTFETLGPVDDIAAAVVAKLEGLGCTGPIEQAVLELRDRVPYILNLRDHIARVHETARKRRLSDWLMEIDADLRLERLTADEAIAKLKSAFERGKRAA